jgi:hypothetical protein
MGGPTYHLRDDFGPIPTPGTARLCDAIRDARHKAVTWNRTIVVDEGGTYEWVVTSRKQVTKRKTGG